jgi:tRNA (guanine-N7-)-methyltransferase
MEYQLRSYVMRPGRITKLQQKSLETLTERYCLSYSEAELDPASLFLEAEKIVLEIGFGMGTATAEIASANPHCGYIGVEVFRAGVGKLLSEIEGRGLSNVRIIMHDAVEVVRSMLPEGRLDGVHIFFPDPWPKKRHHKRRLLQPPFVELLASKLRPGGYLYAVTDWDDYAEQILSVFTRCAHLQNVYDGYATPQDWRPQTKFERKGLTVDHSIHEIYFTKV